MTYDEAASVDAEFDTETLGGATVPATTTQLSAANSGVPSGPFSPFAGQRVYDPAGGAAGTITASGLFPFTDGYGLFGGGCPGADPTDNDPDYYTTYPAAFVDVEPGEAPPAVKVRLPSINLRVLYNGNPLNAVQTATTRIVVYSKGPNCTEKFTFNAPATDANGWHARAGAAVRQLHRVRRGDHAGARDSTAARACSPASGTGTTAA